jgi:hypothetical protein
MPDRLLVTLNPKGGFVVTLPTYQKMKQPEAVVLLYDRETLTIGVRPSRLEVPHAIRVHKRHERYSRVFRSFRFLEKHRIAIPHSVQFPTATIDDEGVLILNLREMVASSSMPRLPRGKPEE